MGRIGQGTKQLTANVAKDVVAEVDALAKRSGTTRSEYLRRLVEYARAKNIHFVTETQIVVAEEAAPYTTPTTDIKPRRVERVKVPPAPVVPAQEAPVRAASGQRRK